MRSFHIPSSPTACAFFSFGLSIMDRSLDCDHLERGKSSCQAEVSSGNLSIEQRSQQRGCEPPCRPGQDGTFWGQRDCSVVEVLLVGKATTLFVRGFVAVVFRQEGNLSHLRLRARHRAAVANAVTVYRPSTLGRIPHVFSARRRLSSLPGPCVARSLLRNSSFRFREPEGPRPRSPDPRVQTQPLKPMPLPNRSANATFRVPT